MARPVVARSVLAGGALCVALLVGACDDDGADDVIEPTIVDDPGVPFDPNVPEGVDTSTDEQGNLGFDDEQPGP
ncbi:MAG TPA: hypothetical protein VK853_12235 [Ilumatobacteraceae bacterium]|nr:hypothetical protein [Ilumatobacteraceae bacterium]